MRVIHGELPPMRYPGLYKDAGPQYVRGVSEWSSDGSFSDTGVWRVRGQRNSAYPDVFLVHAVRDPHCGANTDADTWNTYSLKWAPATARREPGGVTTLTFERRPRR